jgi:thiamine kinase-like enzyme
VQATDNALIVAPRLIWPSLRVCVRLKQKSKGKSGRSSKCCCEKLVALLTDREAGPTNSQSSDRAAYLQRTIRTEHTFGKEENERFSQFLFD